MRMSLLAIAATAGIGFGVTAAKAELLVPLVTDGAAPAARRPAAVPRRDVARERARGGGAEP